MSGGEVRLGGTGWVAEVIRPLAAQRPLNQRLLTRREAVSISSAVSGPADELIKNLSRNRRQDLAAAFADSVCGAYSLLLLCPTHKIPDTLIRESASRKKSE